MSAPAVVARPMLTRAWRRLGGVATGLSAGLLVLGLAFHTEIAAAIAVWISSTAYNHCFLILPITAYLIWDRRATLRGLPVVPVPALAFAAIPLLLAWLVAERLGIMEGRQLVAMTFVELLLLAVFGWRLWWALSGPLLYLYFLVPFGYFVTPRLQDFTTGFVQVGLNVLHIPAYINGFTIEIPEGTFYVAEACAGLRFLIASIAFGWLYALLMYRSPLRRGMFLLASLIVPVIANGFRALGIVVLGHILGSAEAAATDHILYGWLFFSLVILLLIALGLPFRQDQRDAAPAPAAGQHPTPPGPGVLRRVLYATVLVCVFAIVGPGLTMVLARTGGGAQATAPLADLGPGCRLQPDTDAPPLPGLRATIQHATCGDLPVQVRTVVLSRHATAGPVYATERQMIAGGGEDGVAVSWIPPAPGKTPIWRLVQSPDLGFVTAVSMWVDGRPAQPGLAERLRLAWTSLPGARLAPVVITVTPAVDWSRLGHEQRRQAVARLVQLLQNWSDAEQQVRRIAGGG